MILQSTTYKLNSKFLAIVLQLTAALLTEAKDEHYFTFYCDFRARSEAHIRNEDSLVLVYF